MKRSSLVIRQWSDAWQRAVRMLTRERSWGTSLFLVICALSALQLLFLALAGFRAASASLARAAELRIAVQAGASETRIQDLVAVLNENSSVERVRFITAEQALSEQQGDDPALQEFMKRYPLQNPFPDAIALQLTSISAYESVRAFLADPQWSGVISPSALPAMSSSESRVREVLRTTESIRLLGTVFCIAMGILCLAIVWQLTLQALRQHKRDIALLQLLGAEEQHVVRPFGVEMSILVLLGFLGSIVCAALAVLLLPGLVHDLPSTPLLSGVIGEWKHILSSRVFLWMLMEVIALPLIAYGSVSYGIARMRV